MRKFKPFKIIIHPPAPEDKEKLENVLSSEYARLIEALMTRPKSPAS